MRARHFVRIDRSDGSRTYKGAWVVEHCEKEADAWREAFPDYAVTIVPELEARADVRVWSAAVHENDPAYDGRQPRYYPKEPTTDGHHQPHAA